jgi:hypothetical protein
MKMKCLFSHQWKGCRCERCGALRDEGHVFELAENKCVEVCKICGKEGKISHKWKGCKCEKCDALRDEGHAFELAENKCVEVCKICGKEGKVSHHWKGCKCECCGEQRDEAHSFEPVPGKCQEKCSVCQKTQNKEHHFKPVHGKCVNVCDVCGEEDGSWNAHHSYQPAPSECVEKCTVCGNSRDMKHQYANGKCTRCGTDVNAPDRKTGIPPLIWAALEGEVEEVRALLKGGANVNICTDETPLMAAAKKGYDAKHIEIVEILLAHGADVNATDRYGSSAVRIAQRKGLAKMVALLASHGGRYLGA